MEPGLKVTKIFVDKWVPSHGGALLADLIGALLGLYLPGTFPSESYPSFASFRFLFTNDSPTRIAQIGRGRKSVGSLACAVGWRFSFELVLIKAACTQKRKCEIPREALP
jgi:hypothetical protein